MKTLKLFLLILGILIFSSCSENDESIEQQKGEINFNNNDYPILNGYLISQPEMLLSNSSLHSIFLLNGTILSDGIKSQGCDYSNDTKQNLILNIASPSPTELLEGSYDFNLNNFNSSLRHTSFGYNMTMSNNCVISSDILTTEQIDSGNLTIKKVGDIYKISFSLNTSDFGTITGNYESKLKVISHLTD